MMYTMSKIIFLMMLLIIANPLFSQEPIGLESRNKWSHADVQQKVLYNLNHIQLYGVQMQKIPYPLERSFFSEKAKIRLVALFEQTWTDEELESQIMPMMASVLDTLKKTNGVYKKAKRIAKRNHTPIQQAWDSLVQVKKIAFKEQVKQQPVESILVSIAGLLKDKRFLPFLLALEKKGQAYYGQKEVQMALARYEQEPFHSNMIKKYAYGMYKTAPYHTIQDAIYNLQYIGSKKAVDEILKYTQIDRKNYNHSTESYTGFIADIPIQVLVKMSKNTEFKKEMAALEESSSTINVEDLEKKRKLIEDAYLDYQLPMLRTDQLFLKRIW